MPLSYKALCSFVGGELSPEMIQRIDTPEYNNAVAGMDGFYARIQGGAKKKRGQAFVLKVKDSTQPVLMIPYVLNESFSYNVVINGGYMQFVKNGNVVVTAPNTPFQITCPYQSADLPLIRYAQMGSIIYIAHPNYPIFSLQCITDTNWQLVPTQFTYFASSDSQFSNAFLNFQIINGTTASFTTGTQFTINMNSGLINSYTPLPTFPFVPISQSINLASDGNDFDIATGGIGTSQSPLLMDGINLQVGNYVLLKDQNTPSQNGVYLVNSGSWTRASFYNSAGEINDSQVHPLYGLIWGNQYFDQTATVATVGTDPITFAWSQFPPGTGELAGVTVQLGATGTYIWQVTCLAASASTQQWQVLAIPATYSAPSTFVAITPTYVSPTVFTMSGDQRSYFPTYQFLQFDDPTTLSLQNTPQPGTIPQDYVVSTTFTGGLTHVTISGNYSTIPSDLSQVSCLYNSMWKPGAYPNALCFCEARLMTGGSAQFPNYVWGSRAGGLFLDFTTGVTADMGIIEQVASNDYNQIVHMVNSRQLLLLTTSTEFAMFGASGGPLSGISSNIIKDYTHNGCNLTSRPCRIGKEVLFTQRDGLKTRAITYDIMTDSNQAPDIMVMSNHLTDAGGIVAQAFSQNPDYLLWAVTSDGRLLACCFDRDQKIVAWSPMVSQGNYESICVVPGISSDYTYVQMNYTINGQTVRTVELMDYLQGPANVPGGNSLMDCFFIFNNGSTVTNTITGLPSFMYGATVGVMVNGTYEPNDIVSNTGTITTINSGTYFVIGFPYIGDLELLNPEFGDASAPTMARTKGMTDIFIQVYNTTDLVFNNGKLDQFGNIVSKDVSIPFLTTAQGLGTAPAPYSGLKKVGALGWDTNYQVHIKSTTPTECIVLGVVYKGLLGE